MHLPGASAQVVSETVAAPIEQYVNGVENMLYMSSQCTNDGSYNLTVTFKNGVNLNMAQVMVQNRVALADPLLPDVIKQTGVAVKKKSPDILLAIAFNSQDGRYDQLFLSNYALMQIQPELARVPGVSDVTVLAQRDYSMRIWLDADRLASLKMALATSFAPYANRTRRSPPVKSDNSQLLEGKKPRSRFRLWAGSPTQLSSERWSSRRVQTAESLG